MMPRNGEKQRRKAKTVEDYLEEVLESQYEEFEDDFVESGEFVN